MQSVEEERPPGLKPALNLRDLRGPEGPLFLGDSRVEGFSATRSAIPFIATQSDNF
jgi:hypothetical protein